MFIILGATGHVGAETAKVLLADGERVTVVTRDARNAEALKQMGAEVAVADLRDVERMRQVFSSGQRLFLLNPPAAPETDTDATERETVRCLLAALNGSGLKKVVAESTYGAQPGDYLGDLNTLYELEQGLAAQPIPFSVIRAAYYMSNWDAMVEPARREGVLPTMFPADFVLPMVAPADLGRVAANLLTRPADETGVHYVEGPDRYSPSDVAEAFARALDRPVQPLVTPREDWRQAFRKLGFSEPAARSYARMTAKTVDGDYEMPSDPIRGEVTLQVYVQALCAQKS